MAGQIARHRWELAAVAVGGVVAPVADSSVISVPPPLFYYFRLAKTCDATALYDTTAVPTTTVFCTDYQVIYVSGPSVAPVE